MANRAHILRAFIGVLVLGVVGACTVPIEGADPLRPTVRPLLRITPAPPQDVKGTATAFALVIVPTPTPIGLYIVKPGDSLGNIALNFETTVEEIMALNNIADPNQIEVGQELTIPSLLSTTTAAPEGVAPEVASTILPDPQATVAP